ncbi:Bifunctional inhibitor/lipid-transfer protein/seed storage 2S albumin superfamily protein [Euphorbia peplus]|nr:Bifunctional inhibitor/lipid-transfer protein/seed storage 2S albumin superfamily protein [Euphorbia peplus]
MALSYSQSPITIIFLSVLLFISLPSGTLSQTPTIGDCTPRLLPLTPCAPFVQGLAQSPPTSCCDNLKQLYSQQPGCLCLLLNNTNLSSFPINSTLAMQLPPLCHIQLNNSGCSGVPQVSLGANSNSSSGARGKSDDMPNNSTVAASPMVQVAPRPIIMGLGLGRSACIKLQGAEGALMLLVSLAILLKDGVNYV